MTNNNDKMMTNASYGAINSDKLKDNASYGVFTQDSLDVAFKSCYSQAKTHFYADIDMIGCYDNTHQELNIDN